MSELKPEDKKLHQALNSAMKDGDFFDTILEAAQAKQIQQLQTELKMMTESRDDHSKIRQRHLVKHGKACDKIEQLQAELEKHRWIPVSERLPKDDGQVWILYEKTGYTYNAFYDQNVLHFSQKTWQIFDYSGGYKKAEVEPTHWKPIILPEALNK